MSKVSVFKFNIINNEQNINNINTIIQNYLSSRGFFYNNEKGCYTTGTPTKRDDATNVALSAGVSVASAVLTGGQFGSTVFYSVQHGFEYYIKENQLIIKACIINKNAKSFIHSTFNNSKAGARYYGDLQGSLFKELKNSNITLQSKEVEQINDGSENKTLKILGIFVLIMICIPVLAFLIMYMFNK